MSEEHADRPDTAHTRPDGVSDATVRALSVLSEALETTERARGALYTFHQLTGGADFQLGDAVRLLREAGHDRAAELVDREIVGRNVIPGHWTFQIVEAYDRTYYRPFAEIERSLVDELAAGRTHVYEAELKEARRTRGRPDHTARPDTTPGDR
ncbi:hypothetical protein [Streptomyces sp. NBC_00102]|uniref:hypothetical protein n=1 Tax=Streptomyces sp. NBC_00102 TaxID=2975652 RepID=UPI002252A5EC|nr:hypothetical protein [Streptomyces sp. NBC_00102]MCX5401433.1 hypothetical protein [Streptomyces sp. NBC_00102]